MDDLHDLERHRRNLEHTQTASSGIAAAGFRYAFWGIVLPAARAGTLTANWRDSLTVDVLHGDEEGGQRPPTTPAAQRDAEDLALHEVVTSSVADWEPYTAGGDWRRALDAWYHASIANLDTYETAQKSGWAEIRRHSSTWHEHPPTTLLGRAFRKSPIDDFMSTLKRDELGAWYRAGLAAGGDDIDWIDWYRNRITHWDTTGDSSKGADLKTLILTGLDDTEFIHTQQQLPDYWTSTTDHGRTHD